MMSSSIPDPRRLAPVLQIQVGPKILIFLKSHNYLLSSRAVLIGLLLCLVLMIFSKLNREQEAGLDYRVTAKEQRK